MSGVQKSRTLNPTNRACLQCQKRKSKCTGSDGIKACKYCLKTEKPCIFEAPPSRTSLTRKNLDAAELRIQQLTSLLESLHPELDIDAAIQGLKQVRNTSVDDHSPQQGTFRSTSPSDEYEWHESALSPAEEATVEAGLRDGMASLSTTADESGYLGKDSCRVLQNITDLWIGTSSGSSLLQSISALLPHSSSNQSNDIQHHPDSIEATSAEESVQYSNALPMNGHLAASAVLDRLIDAYFIFYNSSYPILHEKTFRDRYQNKSQVNAKSSWHIIFYMILTIGHWVTSDSADDQSPYFAAARSRLSINMLESGTLGTVQAFLLLVSSLSCFATSSE